MGSCLREPAAGETEPGRKAEPRNGPSDELGRRRRGWSLFPPENRPGGAASGESRRLHSLRVGAAVAAAGPRESSIGSRYRTLETVWIAEKGSDALPANSADREEFLTIL